MSDSIKHECGIVMIRLLKPLDFYYKKYGTVLYGLNKLYLLMQKQHNRGQDGAGVATIKLDMPLGKPYINRFRSADAKPLREIFKHIHTGLQDVSEKKMANPKWLKEKMPFIGELLLGHLRYGTHGANTIAACHPFLRQNNWLTRNLVLAGNFNLTNVDELFGHLIELGQNPKGESDTVTVMEKIGHFLDFEVERLYNWFKSDSENYSNREITDLISERMNVQQILINSARKFDGGYLMCGMIGHGDAFAMRDPAGVRPGYYYQDDEVVVVASERPAIQTAFDVPFGKIKELKPAHALIIKKSGAVSEVPYIKATPRKACSFERIYFSRGTDRDIYLERQRLGQQLVKRVLKSVKYDFENTVFSFVPNTAEVAFYGLLKGIEDQLSIRKRKEILKLGKNITEKDLKKILSQRARMEKIAVKDAKLRTFIADDASRGELVSHVYDVTYGIVRNGKDTLVLLDDSIVRGTTLRQSIIKIVARLQPKRIIIVSSAPQIRYPDCYGIDMSKMKEFVAFRALVSLLKKNGKEKLLKKAYKRCKEQEKRSKEDIKNEVQVLYEEFSAEEISKEIALLVTPDEVKVDVEVIYQTLEGLHKSCPDHKGDWYFSGNYPTVGGNRIINRAFINYMENRDERAY